MIRDGSDYFGPYPNVKTVYTLLELIRGLYPIRTCNYDLSEEKIQKQSYKVCLEYHIGNCLAPCEAKVSDEDYNLNIAAIRDIIKGNFRRSLNQFKTQMEKYAAANEVMFRALLIRFSKAKSIASVSTFGKVDK